MKLSEMRKAAGYQTQESLAAAIGLEDRARIAQWEIGKSYPRAPTIKKIAEALNVSSDEVIDAITAAKEQAS